MSGIRSLLLSSLVVICVCCYHDDHDNLRKPVTRAINGRVLMVQNLEGYGIVCSYKDYLFLKEDRDTSRLIAYKIDNDSLIYFRGLIDRGRGPREFYYVEYYLCGDTLYVSNSDPSGIKALYGIPLNNIERIDDSGRWKEYTFSEDDIMTGMSFARLTDGRFIIAGGKTDTQQILSLVDFKVKEERTPLHFWPKDSTQGPIASKQMVYMQSSLNSQKGRILYANLYARYMFIASVDENKLQESQVIYSSLPKYVIKPDGNIRYSEDGEYGIQPYSTAEYIFASVGRTVREVKESETYKGYPRWYNDEVEVYDWNGVFIDNYKTDRPFSSFAVSADNQFLYTMTMDLKSKEPVIIRYELRLLGSSDRVE